MWKSFLQQTNSNPLRVLNVNLIFQLVKSLCKRDGYFKMFHANDQNESSLQTNRSWDSFCVCIFQDDLILCCWKLVSAIGIDLLYKCVRFIQDKWTRPSETKVTRFIKFILVKYKQNDREKSWWLFYAVVTVHVFYYYTITFKSLERTHRGVVRAKSTSLLPLF